MGLDRAEINYKRLTTFYGRNGMFNQKGIDIGFYNNDIELHPITSKNRIGSCRINIPKENLQEFIDQLKTFL